MKALWIPADRLLTVLDTIPELNTRLTRSEVRFVFGLRHGYQEFVSFGRTDALLTRLDLELWWHIPEEDGGLADIYENGAQYGSPNRLKMADGTPAPRRYETHEERLAARRATYRRAYERRLERRRAA